MEMQRINMDVPRDLWRRVKVRAAEEGRLMREIVAEALERYLEGATEMARDVEAMSMTMADLTRSMIDKIQWYQAHAHTRGALTAQEQQERAEYVASLPEPLRRIAEALIHEGRDSVLRALGPTTVGIYADAEAEAPIATWTVPAEVAAVVAEMEV